MSNKLYWNKVCPFVQRAWITALEKRFPVELVYVPLGGETPEWYKKVNPRETVPALDANGKIILESSLIMHYIDDATEPRSSLFPGDAFTKHRIRYWQEQVSEFVGAAYGYLRSGTEEAKAELEANLKNLNSLLEKQSPAGPFFLGSVFSVADILVVPFVDRFRYTLKAYHNYDLFTTAPRLKLLIETAFLRPSVSQTSQSEEFYVTSYKSYSTNSPPKQTYKLYSNPRCPFAERARVAAALKNVDHEVIDVDLDDMPKWYMDINPAGTVPALVTPDGRVVHESLLICEYFEEQFPGKGAKLLPDSANDLYDGRFFVDNAGNFRYAIMQFFQHRGNAESRKGLEEGAAVLEELLARQTAQGPFLFGADVTVFDLSITTFLARLHAALELLKDGGAFFAKFPRLNALTHAALKLPGKQPQEFYRNLMKARLQIE